MKLLSFCVSDNRAENNKNPNVFIFNTDISHLLGDRQRNGTDRQRRHTDRQTDKRHSLIMTFNVFFS